MRMRHLTCAALGLGLLIVPALGQNAAPAAGEAKPKGQHHGAKAEGRVQRGPDVDQMMERLTKELNLSQDQQTKVREILVAHREKMMQQMQSPEGQQNREKMKELTQQMQAARQAGDKQKMKEIAGQMKELGSNRQMADARKQMVTDIEAQLNADQKAKFEKMKDGLFAEHLLANHPEMLKQAVASLNLPQDKQQKIDALMQEAKTKADATQDVREKHKIADDLYKKVMSELTPEEQQKVQDWRPARHGSGSAPAAGKPAREGKGKRHGKKSEQPQQ